MFIDNDFPKLLGAELYRPHPAYIVEMAAEPVVVHDFTKQPGYPKIDKPRKQLQSCSRIL